MRVPIYDPLDMELLSVIDLHPEWVRNLDAGVMSVVRFAIRPSVEDYLSSFDEPISPTWYAIAEVRFDMLMHKTIRREAVRTYIGICLNPDICLRIDSTFAPGQQKDVQRIRDEAFQRGANEGFKTALDLIDRLGGE